MQDNVITHTKEAIRKRIEDEARDPTREEVARNQRLKIIEDKFQRALAAYVIRNEDTEDYEVYIHETQYCIQIQCCKCVTLVVYMQNTKDPVVYYGEKKRHVGLLEVAADSAMSECDVQSNLSVSGESTRLVDPRYLIRNDVRNIDLVRTNCAVFLLSNANV